MTKKQRRELEELLSFNMKEALQSCYGLLVALGKLPMPVIASPGGKEMEADARNRPVSLVKRD